MATSAPLPTLTMAPTIPSTTTTQPAKVMRAAALTVTFLISTLKWRISVKIIVQK